MSVFDKFFKCSVKFLSKHSVEITMGAAAIGVALVSYTTAKATLKVNDICKDEDLTKKDKIKKSIAPAAPAVGSIIFTELAIAAMYTLGKKKEAALLSLLVASTNTFAAYRSNVQNKIGKGEEAREFADAMAKSNRTDERVPEVRTLPNEVIFCESMTGQYFVGTKENFWASAYAANGALHEYGMCAFNQWLQFLDCDEVDEIDDFGWTYEGSQYYNYTNMEVNLVKRTSKSGQDYYLIVYSTPPHSMFLYPYDKGCADEDLVLLPLYDTELWKNTSQDDLDKIIDHDIKSAKQRM